MRKDNLKDSKNKLGERIREIRFKTNLNQSQFASQLGVQGKTVSGYELGNQLPSDLILQKISNLHSVTLDELLNLKKEARDLLNNPDNLEFSDVDFDELTIAKLRKLPRPLIDSILGINEINKKDNKILITEDSFQNKLRELQNDWFLGSTKMDSLNYHYQMNDHVGEFKINKKIGVVFTTPTNNIASVNIIEKVLGPATVLLCEGKTDSTAPHNIVYVWINPVLSLVEQFEVLKINYQLLNIVHFQNNHLKTYCEFHDGK
ncbi:helix-turn-helix transcriptional regulator [Gottfriedia solisilvae]|uniref:helix-turn-helix transcriptional regulator n=1 Tax=Gottfriedia solisilvae TaxID=1516104 RepID=UPI003D2EA445